MTSCLTSHGPTKRANVLTSCPELPAISWVPHHGLTWEEPVHSAIRQPALLLHPRSACPRCDRPRVLALAPNIDSVFAWYECEDCGHLWSVPKGWTPHHEGPSLVRAC